MAPISGERAASLTWRRRSGAKRLLQDLGGFHCRRFVVFAKAGPRNAPGEPQKYPCEMEEEGELLVARNGLSVVLIGR